MRLGSFKESEFYSTRQPEAVDRDDVKATVLGGGVAAEVQHDAAQEAGAERIAEPAEAAKVRVPRAFREHLLPRFKKPPGWGRVQAGVGSAA
jgi:hypothetical protein